MTINKNQIIEMVQKILRHQEGLVDRSAIHPTREWFVGLGVSVTLFSIIAIGSGYTYWKNKDVNLGFVQEAPEVTVYRDSQVKDALKAYKNRDTERKALLSGGEPLVLPEIATTTASSTELNTASTTVQDGI